MGMFGDILGGQGSDIGGQVAGAAGSAFGPVGGAIGGFAGGILGGGLQKLFTIKKRKRQEQARVLAEKRAKGEAKFQALSSAQGGQAEPSGGVAAAPEPAAPQPGGAFQLKRPELGGNLFGGGDLSGGGGDLDNMKRQAFLKQVLDLNLKV